MLTMERAPQATMARGTKYGIDTLIRIVAALRDGAVVEMGSLDVPVDCLVTGIVRLAIVDHPLCGFGTYIQSRARYRGCTATSLWMRLQWTLDDLYQEAKLLTADELARLPRVKKDGICSDRLLFR